MVNTNKDWVSMSDKGIISSMGEFVKQQRLTQNKTQLKTAEIAGVNRWTISQIENGEAISLISLIQILRALNILYVLDNFKVETQLSPLEIARMEKKKRQRARMLDENKPDESEW